MIKKIVIHVDLVNGFSAADIDTMITDALCDMGHTVIEIEEYQQSVYINAGE